ncbi:MAG: ABC transporter permease [Chloroflexi bacterium]|nr:ABC transporter permease [Chloroflexota bacterium]MDA1003237.1 ABC transporter permease [Chloroflexota bacterium]
MAVYTLKRIGVAVPTLLLTSIIVFALMRMLPGDVITTQLAGDAAVSEEERDRLRAEYGLDRPLVVQYARWLSGFGTGDLGRSSYTGEGITAALRRTAPVTLQLAIVSIIISIGIGIPLGLISAIARNSPWDNVLRFFSILGLSAPEFWTGTLALTFLAIWFSWVPPTGYRVITSDPLGTLTQLAIPAFLIGYRLVAVIIRMTRSAVLEVMGEDFVRTARAKGLRPTSVWTRHVLRNAMLPVITVIGGQVLALIGGTVIIEQIFALPGIGRLTLDAIIFRDYPLVQSIVFLFAIAVVVVNVVIDLSYAYLDPRIRYS